MGLMNKNDFADLYVIYGESYIYPMTTDELREMLEDDEVHALLKNKLGSKHISDMVKVYNAMLDASVKDKNVNASKWMVDFSKSKFLNETESELEKLAKRVTLIKGGEKNGETITTTEE